MTGRIRTCQGAHSNLWVLYSRQYKLQNFFFFFSDWLRIFVDVIFINLNVLLNINYPLPTPPPSLVLCIFLTVSSWWMLVVKLPYKKKNNYPITDLFLMKSIWYYLKFFLACLLSFSVDVVVFCFSSWKTNLWKILIASFMEVCRKHSSNQFLDL